MNSFRSYMLRIAYSKVEKLSDELSKADKLIDWEAFRLSIKSLYINQGPRAEDPTSTR
jgi:hypothetical protein